MIRRWIEWYEDHIKNARNAYVDGKVQHLELPRAEKIEERDEADHFTQADFAHLRTLLRKEN